MAAMQPIIANLATTVAAATAPDATAPIPGVGTATPTNDVFLVQGSGSQTVANLLDDLTRNFTEGKPQTVVTYVDSPAGARLGPQPAWLGALLPFSS